MSDSHNRHRFEVLTADAWDDREEQLSACHTAARGQRRDSRYWRWRYLEAPDGGALICAFRNGRMVGILGNTYLRARHGEGRVLAGVMGDLSMPVSDRSWACYTGLLQRSLTHGVEHCVSFGYAFAHGNAAALSSRVGTVCVGRMPVWSGFLDVRRALAGRRLGAALSLLVAPGQPLLGVANGERTPGNVVVDSLTDPFDVTFARLWESVAQGRDVGVVRDAPYLNWRYVRRPDARYLRLVARSAGEPAGLAVVRTRPDQRKAYLLELMARDDSPTVLRVLAGEVVRRMAQQGIGLVTACFPPGSAETRVLAAMRFQRWGTRLWDVILTVTPGDRGKREPEASMRRWYFSLGDWLTH